MTRTAHLLGWTMLLPLCGCLVQTHKDSNGHGDDVNIATPLGGLSVKTDPAAVQSKVGLPLYPGATAEEKKDDKNGSADVNMSFGGFHLRVLALAFSSTDSPDKVQAFYRKALAQYSDVIECRGQKPVGQPVKTGLGLTCSDDNHVYFKESSDGASDANDTALKAGSPTRQHVVSFKPSGAGTEFALIALELPHSDSTSGN